jgi:hypothetical protein
MLGVRLKTLMIIALAAGPAVFGSLPPAAAQQEQGSPATLSNIRITAGDKVIRGWLNDSKTSRDLLAQLPLTLSMSRLREREYYGRPASPFSTDADRQQMFDNGDIGYTARSGYFAVFFDNSKDPEISDLIVIGKITSELSDFYDLGQAVDMTIERADGD